MNHKIYDCFLFFNELDVLELRLNILNPYVDFFVLGEAEDTFTGNKKDFIFLQNEERFEKFKSKIIHVPIKASPQFNNPWDREFYQRDMLDTGLTKCFPEDIIMVSDVDEIPNMELIPKVWGAKTLIIRHIMYYYYLDCIATNTFVGGTSLTRKSNFSSPQELRRSAFQKENCQLIDKGGWHFAYMSGVTGIIEKIEAFSHTEFNTEEIKNAKIIEEKMRTGEDILGRGGDSFKFVGINEDHPPYLIKNKDKYKHLISNQKQVMIKKDSRLPLVSVTMLTYKREELFKKTLDSFLKCNTYKNVEFLVWVNSSTPSYEELINSYGDLFTFKYFSKTNQGIGEPRNVLNEKAKGEYILNLEDDFECYASESDNFISRAIDALRKYPDIGQVVFRDIPMPGYSDAEVGELREDCFVMKNRYSNMSPTYTNQANIMPKRIWEEIGPFTQENQEDNFGYPFDKKYKCVKLGHEGDKGFFKHIGLISAASTEDSKMLNTYFCGNPRNDIIRIPRLAIIRAIGGQELFIDAFIKESINYFDHIIVSESDEVDIRWNLKESYLPRWWDNNPKVTHLLINKRYFKKIDEKVEHPYFTNPRLYNLEVVGTYMASKLAGYDADWTFVMDGDELYEKETLLEIDEKLKKYNPDEGFAFSTPTILYSTFVNGKSTLDAFTPMVIHSNKAFHSLQGQRGYIKNSDGMYIHLKTTKPLHHYSYVYTSTLLKYSYHSDIDVNLYLNYKNLEIIPENELPNGIKKRQTDFQNIGLIAPLIAPTGGPTVCLNMMVKNEALNLKRYHAKLAPYIDEYLIVDTGSTDGTKDVIENIFAGIPGKIIDHPFDDYSSCRNKGLDQIQSDWVLMLDADHELQGNFSFLKSLPEDKDQVTMRWVEPDYNLLTKRLLKNKPGLKWFGRCHEVLQNLYETHPKEVKTNEISIYHHNTGSGKKNKFNRELKLLHQDFDEKPNLRTAFYIACDYMWSKKHNEKAVNWFKKYLELAEITPNVWNEELYKVHLYLGRIYQTDGQAELAETHYEKAMKLDREMLEPAVWLAEIKLSQGKHQQAVDLCGSILDITPPERILWYEREVYEHDLANVLSIASYYCEEYELGKKATEWLIQHFPNVEQHRKNLKFYSEKHLATKQIKRVETYKRFHLLGVPTLKIEDKSSVSPYNQIIKNMATILKNLGYYVIYYGVEGSEVEADEIVSIVSKEDYDNYVGLRSPVNLSLEMFFYMDQPYFKNGIQKLHDELKKRVNNHHEDIVLITHTAVEKALIPIKDKFVGLEYSVGYPYRFADFCIYPTNHQQTAVRVLTEDKLSYCSVKNYDFVIPHPVDSTIYYPEKNPANDYFVNLGRQQQGKGLTILKILAELSNIPFKLAGPVGNGVEEEFEKDVKNGLYTHIPIVIGKNKQQLLANAKAMIAPSQVFETFHIASVEAMMCGTPVITTDGGSFVETIEHGKTGFRCKTKKDFLEAMQLVDTLDRDYIREYAYNKFSIEKLTPKYQEVFVRLHSMFEKGWYNEEDDGTSVLNL